MNDRQFSKRRPKIIGEEQLRKYAVLVPIIETSEGLVLLFERRSSKLKKEPGEICFPGGKLEKNETLAECAKRETMEELLISKDQIDLIGPGDILISPFNIIIYPYLGLIHDYQDTFSTDEVSELIKVPLDFFLNHQPEQYKSKVLNSLPEDFPYEWVPNGENYSWESGTYDINFYRYNEIIIWGITAHIIKSMIRLMKEYQLLDQLKL